MCKSIIELNYLFCRMHIRPANTLVDPAEMERRDMQRKKHLEHMVRIKVKLFYSMYIVDVQIYVLQNTWVKNGYYVITINTDNTITQLKTSLVLMLQWAC